MLAKSHHNSIALLRGFPIQTVQYLSTKNKFNRCLDKNQSIFGENTNSNSPSEKKEILICHMLYGLSKLTAICIRIVMAYTIFFANKKTAFPKVFLTDVFANALSKYALNFRKRTSVQTKSSYSFTTYLHRYSP